MSDLQELKIGSTRIVALKDGELSIPKEILLNLDEDTSNRITEENPKYAEALIGSSKGPDVTKNWIRAETINRNSNKI